MPVDPHPASVGQPAPLFTLPSVQGPTIDLKSYRGQQSVIVWFSRGFTCHFCRGYMQGVIEGYRGLLAQATEIVQVTPNFLESARAFFRPDPVPYPVVCDPDKRLYAVYGLGDRGALAATQAGVVSFAAAFATGKPGPQIRGAWHDVANRNFLRRLHHHATSAVEQGIFLVDRGGTVRHRAVLGPLAAIPTGAELAALARVHAADGSPPA
ncbi:MAG TPA: redoxin domain-containing protein [Methylomirabilota bacterium]|nr:redoxin domain-containing protein [Methylomirabilota bacterium]